MLEFKAIQAEDFDRYNKYRAHDNTYASEGVFATMFIWNVYYNLECADNGEFFFLRFNIRGKESAYFFPIGKGNLSRAIEELSEVSHSRGEKLKFMLVTRENRDKLNSLFPGKFKSVETRNSFDYVYRVERMISLSGKKLHSKRNHLNYFLDNYNFEYVKVETPELLEKCRCKALSLVRQKKKNLNSFEEGAMEKYFDNFFRFKQTGGALVIDGDIVAMTFGERLNSETALVQIELADEKYRGAYQTINKLFCEKEWNDCAFVNREEDMGIEGLRRAKESYQPEFLVEKYVIEEDLL
jgi:hypothetical protein